MSSLRLYNELAAWWPLFSPPEEYVEEAEDLFRLLDEALPFSPRTVLELGSGGGSLGFHLKARYEITFVELSPGMLTISQGINPECEHLVGDMRTVRLGRQFDMIFIHDAITYMTTEEDLRQAMESAFVHCRAGGVAVLVPDNVAETFESTTEEGGRDGGTHALRFLEWSFDPDPADTVYDVHYAIILRENDRVTVEHDYHQNGIFPRAVWLRLLREAGFEPQSIIDGYGRDIFIAHKPEH